jgi:hypothetical protein
MVPNRASPKTRRRSPQASEIMLEKHEDPDIARKVQVEMHAFLRRVKEGSI